MPVDQRPIAVFDSGLGGLTVVCELRRRLPAEDIVYLGDSARVPYGTKTADTVMRFARENCAFLLRTDPKCIIVACNTASAVCLPALADEVPVPVFGVVVPGARAAIANTGKGQLIAVIATEATVSSNAYKLAIQRLDASRPVVQASCPLFVPLVEEGHDSEDPLVQLAIGRYLAPLKRLRPSVVVLGCTHYPMLGDALAGYFGQRTVMIDSASATADAVAGSLGESGKLSVSSRRGTLHCYVSDNPKRFLNVGSRFLGERLHDVVRVCPEELAGAYVDEIPKIRPRASA